jgi:hypothetical protein
MKKLWEKLKEIDSKLQPVDVIPLILISHAVIGAAFGLWAAYGQ